MYLMDLHLHTNFSDGENTIEDICLYAKQYNFTKLCITDHNTVAGTLALEREKKKGSIFIYGTELRLPGMPDLLIYFPSISMPEAERLEEELQELGKLDQDITVLVAKDFFAEDPLTLWHKSTFHNNKGNYWLGTLQLCQLISGQKKPEIKLLDSIRAKKSYFFHLEKKYQPQAVHDLLEKSNIKWIKKLAKKYKGHLVLAHPFREVARHYHSQNPMDYDSLSQKLKELLNKISEWDISTIEYIVANNETWWNSHFNFSFDLAEKLFFDLCNQFSFTVTFGSDYHILPSTKNISNKKMFSPLGTYCPTWLQK